MDDESPLDRACVACDAIYNGGIECPDCGEPGEPLEDQNDKSPRRG